MPRQADDKLIVRVRDAVAFLHAALPPAAGITVTRVEWSVARMDTAAATLTRLDPLRCDSGGEWAVSVSYAAAEGAYAEVTLDSKLDPAVRAAASKFQGWWFAAQKGADKPPKQDAPGAAAAPATKRRRPAG